MPKAGSCSGCQPSAPGAEGEAKAAERILGRAGDNALFLHNRLLGPDRRDGDIDLLAVTPAGVVVIDVKHHKDAKVEVRSSGSSRSPACAARGASARAESCLWTALPGAGPVHRHRQAGSRASDTLGPLEPTSSGLRRSRHESTGSGRREHGIPFLERVPTHRGQRLDSGYQSRCCPLNLLMRRRVVNGEGPSRRPEGAGCTIQRSTRSLGRTTLPCTALRCS